MRGDEGPYLSPGEQVGGYTVVRELGRGAMAVVYEVLQRGLGRRAALKMLLPGIGEKREVRLRFEREGKATARVHHPHVVQVFDVGEHDGQPWLVMEFLEGGDLKRFLGTHGALAVTVAVDLMLPTLAGVQAAHDEGVVHRDLKPANIVIATRRDGEPHPVVVDFGVACAVHGDFDDLQTRTGAVIGTPAYLAPEQALGMRANAQSDQYALAVILYECLAGRRAFSGQGLLKIMTAVTQGACAPLAELRPDLPPALVAVIERAMALTSEARFPSVRDLGAALLPFASDQARALWSSAFPLETPLSLEVSSDIHRRAVAPEPDPPASSARSRQRRSLVIALMALGVIASSLAVALREPGLTTRPHARPLERTSAALQANETRPPSPVIAPPAASPPPSAPSAPPPSGAGADRRPAPRAARRVAARPAPPPAQSARDPESRRTERLGEGTSIFTSLGAPP